MKIVSLRIVVVLSALSAFAWCAAARLSADPITGGDLGATTGVDAKSQEIADAVARFKDRDFDGALKLLKEAVKKNADLPPAQVILAQLFSQANIPMGVRNALEQTVVESADDPEAYVIMGDIALRERQVTAASLLYAKAASLIGRAPDGSWSVLGLHGSSLYVAIGILGATVMPHNLYLHSSIVQTRRYEETSAGKREAIRYAVLDSTVALMMALFINGAILVVAAAVFFRTGHHEVAEIQDAYKLLTPLLGVGGASTVFALALLASGQNSTLTGTLAGQITMEGFLDIRLRPWLRRLITRALAIAPAIIVVFLYGQSGTAKLIILSQVVLSMQLSFAVFPLVKFTSERAKMGEFVNGRWLKWLAYAVAYFILGLNLWLLIQIFRG